MRLLPARREPFRWFMPYRGHVPPFLTLLFPGRQRFTIHNDTSVPLAAALRIRDEGGKVLHQARAAADPGATAWFTVVRMVHGVYFLEVEAGSHRLVQPVLCWGGAGRFRFPVRDDGIALEGEGFDSLLPDDVPGVLA